MFFVFHHVVDLTLHALGTIPNTLGYLPFLTELSLRNNNFTGEIPFEFGIPFVPNPEDCGELSELHVQLGRHCFWFNTRTIAVLDVRLGARVRWVEWC